MASPQVYLYYRTLTTRVVDPGYTTVPLFISNAPGVQVLAFTPPNDLFETWTKQYDNNISVTTIPNNIGTRSSNTIDNGFAGCTITITGRFINNTADGDNKKLETFASQLQSDTYHQWGNIGLYNPNAPRYNLDPDSTKGYMIKGFQFKRMGNQPDNIDFILTLTFGGTYVPQ